MTLFTFPKWWHGPQDPSMFGMLVYEALRYKRGQHSMCFTFPKGDPLPRVSTRELEQWICKVTDYEKLVS